MRQFSLFKLFVLIGMQLLLQKLLFTTIVLFTINTIMKICIFSYLEIIKEAYFVKSAKKK